VTDPRYALVPVGHLATSALRTVRGIYEDGFPPHLRSDFAALIGGEQEGEFALALMRGPLPCGFAMLRALGETGWVFMRYFVVDRKLRGQGLGGVMWDQLTAWLRAGGNTLLVFDVEDPAEPGCGDAESRIRSRRIAFYQRNGAHVLPARGYRTPAGGGDNHGWTPMLLLTAPLGGGCAVTGARQARAVLSAVYRYRWQLSPEHPQVSAVDVGVDPLGSALRGEESSAVGRATPAGGRGADMAAVDYELRKSVAHIYLNRPHRLNAVVPELTTGLVAALARAREDRARVVVLAGRGRAFCSGHDLKEPQSAESLLATRIRVDGIQEVTRQIRRFAGPVIAAVHGYALGAGCEFALGCDLVVASEDAQFGFPEVSVGLSVTGGISRLLPLLVGPVRAKELVLLGERIGAARALDLGLINVVAPAGEHEHVAADLAARLGEQPALALALAKQALDRGADCALEEAMAAEADFAALTVARDPAGPGDEAGAA
jgi:2-(1,2-epoxy-1,2-dihydrophenyl)acetyl-CoA isomerase